MGITFGILKINFQEKTVLHLSIIRSYEVKVYNFFAAIYARVYQFGNNFNLLYMFLLEIFQTFSVCSIDLLKTE